MKFPASLADALEFAKQKHSGQTRKHGTPYIEHPLSVALVLAGWGYNGEDLLVSAVLHDVVEDCGVTIQCISDHFGEQVASTVKLLTKEKTDQEVKSGLIGYYESLTSSRPACLIKVADRLDNVKSLSHLDEQEQAEYGLKTRRDFLPFIAQCAARYPEDHLYWVEMERAILSLITQASCGSNNC